jgi:hypothetical protein
MGMNATGKRIVECAMELMRVKELLFDLSRADLTPDQQVQLARLEQRKLDLLAEVGVLDRAPNPDSPLYSG